MPRSVARCARTTVIIMTIREQERRQRQRTESHRQNEEHRQRRPRKAKRYLRKIDLCARYGWKVTVSVDRAWMKYHTLPPPTIVQGRRPLWDEEALDAWDAAHRSEASA
jgi:hypothetical protein